MTKSSKNNEILSAAHHDFNGELSRYANYKTHNAVLSADLIQTTYMKTWQYLQRTGKIELMHAFLYHVLNGLIVDEYRKKSAASLDLNIANGFEPEDTRSEKIYDHIDGKALALLIEKLPEKYRRAITMKFIEDLSLKEMSSVAQVSQNTMSVRVHRGLAKLRLLVIYPETVPGSARHYAVR